MASRAFCPRRYLRRSPHTAWINRSCWHLKNQDRCPTSRQCLPTTAVHTKVQEQSHTRRITADHTRGNAASKKNTVPTTMQGSNNSNRMPRKVGVKSPSN